MKAIRVEQFGEPEVMKLVEVPKPRPSPGQLLIRVHAIGVNQVDTYIRAGTYPFKPKLPYTPGSDGAGVVDEVSDPPSASSNGAGCLWKNRARAVIKWERTPIYSPNQEQRPLIRVVRHECPIYP